MRAIERTESMRRESVHQTGKGGLTAEHKAAMAIGRAEGKIVRDYLQALRSVTPQRGRRRKPETIRTRLAAIERESEGANPVKRLKLIQERMQLDAELASSESAVDVAKLESAFVRVAQSYSQRCGISYAAWRQVGVAPAVLAMAGISRH